MECSSDHIPGYGVDNQHIGILLKPDTYAGLYLGRGGRRGKDDTVVPGREHFVPVENQKARTAYANTTKHVPIGDRSCRIEAISKDHLAILIENNNACLRCTCNG